MRRRAFIKILGGAAASSVLCLQAARANPPPRMRRIGVLMGGAEQDLDWQRLAPALVQELKTLGWDRDRDLRIDFRWPGDDIERINAMAIELVEMGPDLIVAAATPGVQAVRRRTDSIPIVFINAADPVGNGLVANFARPGGKTTGFTAAEYTIGEKWVAIVKEIAPRTARIGILFNPDTAPYARFFLMPLEAPAAARATKPVPLPFRTDGEVERAIDEFAKTPNGALLTIPDSSTALSRRMIIDAASRNKLPAIFPYRFFVADGGLASFNADTVAQCKAAATYVDRILRGHDAGDLPVQLPLRYELVVNAKTARALNVAIPPGLLGRADEVIE